MDPVERCRRSAGSRASWRAGALTDAEQCTQFTAVQMRSLLRVEQEIDGVDRVGHPTRPGVTVTSHQRRRPFARKGRHQLSGEQAYSSVRCARQTASVRPTIVSTRGLILFGTDRADIEATMARSFGHAKSAVDTSKSRGAYAP